MTKQDVWGWLKKAWKYAPLLLVIYGWYDSNIKQESRVEYLEKALAETKKRDEEIEDRWRADVKDERKSYLEWVSNQKPIITHATNTVREYERTTAGRSMCLDPDGVQRFQAQRQLIEQTNPATPTSQDP